MSGKVMRWPALLAALVLVLPMIGASPVYSQQESRTFPETGKSVQGKFLQYWMTHGGLPQQGYPISDEMQEKSDTDGKSYTVQYFERAVFELHPENQPPNDVLLSLLGVFLYKELYPSGAPDQTPNNDAGSVLFPETGKRVGGLFLDYWRQNGGLAQQGYPISDEFTEVSRLDRKPYKVQYFERAVFELHPENQPPYNVLLSQLGRFRYESARVTPTPTTTPIIGPPSPTPPAADLCSGIPAGNDMTVMPNCGPAGTTFDFEGQGFVPGEAVGVYATTPTGEVFGTRVTEEADSQGKLKGWWLLTTTSVPTGIWAATMEGLDSQFKAIGYFKVTAPVPPDCSGVPAPTNVVVRPNCGPAGSSFTFEASGLQFRETAGVYLTSPRGTVIPWTRLGVDGEGKTLPPVITLRTNSGFDRGIWAVTFEGERSHNVARGFFKIYAP